MQIIKVNPFVQSEIVKEVALVYQEAFGDEPWNEGYVCPLCEKIFARTYSGKTCPVCAEQRYSVLLIEYWPKSKVILDFYHEMKKPDSVCVVAQTDERVIGFAWGYRVFVNPNLDLRLEAPNLHKLIAGDFFYLDECALLPSYQGQGIGKVLVRQILNEHQQNQVLLRTLRDSRMYNLIKKMGGEIVQHISQRRVIMLIPL